LLTSKLICGSAIWSLASEFSLSFTLLQSSICNLFSRYWSYTYLNEAFARYFQYFGTDWINPTWDLENQFVVENLLQSMILDSTDATHPMVHEVYTKSDNANMFDNISYNKGSSILRMLRYLIGETNYKATLSHYLKNK